jgi:MoaD family protein
MTARVKIQLFAMFREIAGKKEIVKDIHSGMTLGEVLVELARKYDKDFAETIDEKIGQVDFNTLVMLNGRNIRDIDEKLKDNDLIIITVPVGGG